MRISRADKPDTAADIALRSCLDGPQKRSFIMVAGAGSGKTTSLVKALATTIKTHGKSLRLARQQVACITYTEVAAREIWADVGNNPIVHVSTIHSFLWMMTRPFQRDIKAWVIRRIGERIDELVATEAAFGPRVQQRTREKNVRDTERLRASVAQVELIESFTYGTGSDYLNGILGHDDIIRMATDLLRERPLFRRLLAQQFPFVFVDESQDTQDVVVDSLKAVAAQSGGKFCLGFFGDPMQRIYPTGVGPIALEEGWRLIEKVENFRCPVRVLSVANAIRRDGDDLVQTGGRTQEVGGVHQPVEGTARIFVLPADDQRNERLRAVREFVAREDRNPSWEDGPAGDVKLLVIVHRMAANRLGFGGLYAALNDRAPSAFRDGFLDATAWPVRPFESFILPIAEATDRGEEFTAMTLLREHCPLLQKEAIPRVGLSRVLAAIRANLTRLHELMAPGSEATVREVLNHIRETRLMALDPRILAHLDERVPARNAGAVANGEDDEEESTREIAAMDAFLECNVTQFWSYRQYVQQLSPFSTQQGIKGAEFERVLVVLDDDEGTHVQFSYDRYFGVKPPTRQDLVNLAEGKETAVERTRRLFYVCATRALSDLVIVYFSTLPDEAERRVRASGIFPEDAIFTSDALV